MIEVIAVAGLVLFWLNLFWLPLISARILRARGAAQTWNVSALGTFLVAVLGYTYTMGNASIIAQGVMSVALALPLGLALYARALPGAPWRWADKWVGAAAVASFLPANLVLIPTGLLLLLKTLVWS